MTVWVLIAEALYDAMGECIEDGFVVGVYATQMLAQDSLDGLLKVNKWRKAHNYSIDQFELEEV